MRSLGLLCLLGISAALQAQSSAPIEPLSKPFAFNLGFQEKYSFLKKADTHVPSVTLDYRTLENRIRFGVTYSETIETREKVVSGSINLKVFEFGRRKYVKGKHGADIGATSGTGNP